MLCTERKIQENESCIEEKYKSEENVLQCQQTLLDSFYESHIENLASFIAKYPGITVSGFFI